VRSSQELAAARGLDPSRFLERRELVERLLADDGGAQGGGNSTATTCAICSSDYERGDALRVLRCGHKFHIEVWHGVVVGRPTRTAGVHQPLGTTVQLSA
jgi:hypothetical protein